MGFRGSKKTHLMQLKLQLKMHLKIAVEGGLRKVKAFVKGPGNGRESAIRTIHNSGIEVTEIVDVTPIAS